MESVKSQSRIDVHNRLMGLGFHIVVLAVSGASVWWTIVEGGRGSGGWSNEPNLVVLLIAAFAAGISHIPAAKRGSENLVSAGLGAALAVSIPTLIWIALWAKGEAGAYLLVLVM